MIEIQTTAQFRKWLKGLRDHVAKSRIRARLRLAEMGHVGDVKPVGNKVFEMRIAVGPGYRLYFTPEGDSIIILLVGGDKGTQKRDIKNATEIAKQIRN